MRTSALPLFVFAMAMSALACGAPPAQVAGAITISDDVARQVRRGVFEVVVPKPSDGGVTYATPPDDLLAFAARGAKFLPLGTAFAVSPTRFVTAAHVVTALPRSSLYLRDGAGTTYEVSRIVALSQRRDLAVFELGRPPPDVVPLAIRRSAAIGDAVFTVGNAGGEGIVIRGGTLTSFTPERGNGEWQDLRFTSPSSPGNSGGPLVDAAGRVLGTVVGGNPVNVLNAAIPTAELDKLAADRADFSSAGIPLKQDLHEAYVDVSYTTPLPSSLADVHRAARQAFLEALARRYAELDEKFKLELFPHHPGLQTYLQEPNIPIGISAFAVDGNGTWHTSQPTYAATDVAPGQKMFSVASADKSRGELLLDRPKSMPLATFFESPAAIADAVIRHESWTVHYAGKDIRITSLGAPEENERSVDEYGRPWFTFTWRLARTRESVVFTCLTNPAGWACLWNRIPTAGEDAIRLTIKRWLRRVTFGYYGRISDWSEFLALPDRYKPTVLNGASVHFDKELTVNVGPLVAEHLSVPALSRESSLYAHVSLDASLRNQRIYDVYVNPRVEKAYSFGVHEVLAPPPGSPDVQVKRWTALQNGSAPFDDVPAVETASMNAMKRGVKGSPTTDGRPRMYLEYCRNPATDQKTELQATCAKFRDALKLEARR